MIAYWFSLYPDLMILILFMGLDIITGLLKAIDQKKLNSDICGKGMRRKAVMLIVILAALSFDKFLGNTPVSEFLVIGFSLSEIISILENAKELGAPIPNRVMNLFETIENNYRVGDSKTEYKRINELREEDNTIS